MRRRRSGSANDQTRVLLANVAALEAVVAPRTAERLDADRWALRWLEANRPGHVLSPARLSAADQAKLAHAQADQIVTVIRAVLEGLNLSDQDWERGCDIAIAALKGAAAEGWEPL